jgi:hypothetical protein
LNTTQHIAPYITPTPRIAPLFTVNPYAKHITAVHQEALVTDTGPKKTTSNTSSLPPNCNINQIISAKTNADNNTITSISSQEDWETKSYDLFDKKLSPYSIPLPFQSPNED